jgi:hypothetical protein
MRRIRRAVIQFRVHVHHPGLPRASLENLPVGPIYLCNLPALRHSVFRDPTLTFEAQPRRFAFCLRIAKVSLSRGMP